MQVWAAHHPTLPRLAPGHSFSGGAWSIHTLCSSASAVGRRQGTRRRQDRISAWASGDTICQTGASKDHLQAQQTWRAAVAGRSLAFTQNCLPDRLITQCGRNDGGRGSHLPNSTLRRIWGTDPASKGVRPLSIQKSRHPAAQMSTSAPHPGRQELHVKDCMQQDLPAAVAGKEATAELDKSAGTYTALSSRRGDA